MLRSSENGNLFSLHVLLQYIGKQFPTLSKNERPNRFVELRCPITSPTIIEAREL